MAPQGTTRQNMLVSAVDLLRERGAAGVTVDAILTRSGAPRGSVYYHFPGGRGQIMTESLELAGTTITSVITKAADKGPSAALRVFADFWTASLRASDYALGCPVVAAAVGGSPDDQALVPTAAAIFQTWHEALVRALEDKGVGRPRANRLARTTVAAIEGAVVLCRAQRSTAPLDEVIEELDGLLLAAVGDQGR